MQRIGRQTSVFLGVLGAAFSFVTQGYAGGYSVPEHSTNAVATAGAYVAAAHGADTGFSNPANMVWEKEDGGKFEFDLTYIHLPKTDFKGTVSGAEASALSREEHIPYPNLHYVSPAFRDFRFGFALVPATFGLTKRWSTPAQATSAQEFTLQTLEINPTIAYKVNESLSVGAGLRGIYSSSKVISDGYTTLAGVGNTRLARNMKGDSFDFGYNLALTLKPVDNLNVAVTFRSEVKPTIKGDVELLTTYGGTTKTHSDVTSVSVVLPATLNIAASYTWGNTTVEALFERMFWSTYKFLDFQYGRPIADAILKASFDDPVTKNWKDTNAFRFGITHQWDESLTVMAGYAYENNPIPNESLGFELPDANSHIFAVGGKYRLCEGTRLGFSLLHNQFVSRYVQESKQGTFKSSAQIVNVSYEYDF